MQSKKSVKGPVSWSCAFEESTGRFYVDALFLSQEAVDFHRANIADITAGAVMGPLMAAPRVTTIREVFRVAS
ncbi:MAG: hypothetical protein WCJ30_15115 [Deltaproteobacteria bacterium]